MPEYIDIHSHVTFAAFNEDREAVVARTLEQKTWMINVGTQQATSKSAVELAEKYEKGVYAIVGLHPIHTDASHHDEQELGEGSKAFTSRGEAFDYGYYKQLASHSKVVAIGECGLDYYRLESDSVKKQKETFEQHIALADELKKPLMLHVRNGSQKSAYTDAFEMLKTAASVKGNVHFYVGSIEEAKPLLERGCTFSFTGVITFARNYDDVIKYLPLEAIMSETDCPYVTPVPHRGTRNEPIYVQEVVKKIAEIKGLPFERVRQQLVENARNFFKI
ncbi:MAG TPA: TatD family hydrolase [Candidatus Paceibacterota bacterium]